MLRTLPLLLGWCVCTHSAAMADVLPLTEVFRVNSALLGSQTHPDVIRTRGRGFSVAWRGEVIDHPSAGYYVYGREFDSHAESIGRDHPLSDPVLPHASDEIVRLARLGGGRRVAVWEDATGKDGDGRGVFGAALDRFGARVGSVFQVDQVHTDGIQRNASIAVRRGQFLVAWSDEGPFETGRIQIRVQLFDRNAERLGDEIVLATTPHEYTYWPSVAALHGSHEGDFIIAWESGYLPAPETAYDIGARIVHPDGTASGRFLLNQPIGQVDQGNPSLASSDDALIATWTTYFRGGSNVYARLFTSSAEPVADEFRVNTTEADSHSGSNVAISPTGDFVIVWTRTADGGGTRVFGQAFKKDGSRLGGEFELSTRFHGFQGDSYLRTHLAFISDTDFVAAWTERNGDSQPDIDARVFRVTPDRRLCGDATDSDLVVETSDALALLRKSVGIDVPCELCNCDVNGSGDVTVEDAMTDLRLAIGLEAATACPACSY